MSPIRMPTSEHNFKTLLSHALEFCLAPKSKSMSYFASRIKGESHMQTGSKQYCTSGSVLLMFWQQLPLSPVKKYTCSKCLQCLPLPEAYCMPQDAERSDKSIRFKTTAPSKHRCKQQFDRGMPIPTWKPIRLHMYVSTKLLWPDVPVPN